MKQIDNRQKQNIQAKSSPERFSSAKHKKAIKDFDETHRMRIKEKKIHPAGNEQAPAGEVPKEVQVPVHATPKVGRNDPCPCGSGLKYKKCCLKKKEGGAAKV